MQPFENQNFLITGGASGIGLATARLLKEKKARLFLWDINPEVEKAAAELEAQAAVVDITQPAQIQQAMQETINKLGELHGIVHAAGILYSGSFTHMPVEQQRRMVDVNLTGSILVANAAAPHLQQTRGSLVFLASVSAFYGPPEFATYGASKAGVLALAQALRLELEPKGVHVGVVCPFFVATPMITPNVRQADMFRHFGTSHTAVEVAHSILQGIGRRHFMIWPNAYPVLFHWLSHTFYPFRHFLMRLLWWQARRAQQRKEAPKTQAEERNLRSKERRA